MRRDINSYDSLARSMEEVMASDEHQKVFQLKTKVKIASAPKPELTVAEHIMDLFLKTSVQLDDLGLINSSIKTLQAAEIFRQEMKKIAEEDDGLLEPDMEKLREQAKKDYKYDPDVIGEQGSFKENLEDFMNPILERVNPEWTLRTDRIDIDPANMSLVMPVDDPLDDDETFAKADPVGYLHSDEGDYPQELEMESMLDDPDFIEDEELEEGLEDE